jgi:hypothetical protein
LAAEYRLFHVYDAADVFAIERATRSGDAWDAKQQGGDHSGISHGPTSVHGFGWCQQARIIAGCSQLLRAQVSRV